MTNNYYNFTPPFVPGSRVRAGAVNTQFAAVEAAFDNLPANIDTLATGRSTFGTESGSGNAYAVAMTDVRLAATNGDEVVFFATHTNTGATTLAVDAIAAVPLVRFDGAAMQAGDIVSGLAYAVRYDNTNIRYQMMTPSLSFLTDIQTSETNAATSASNASTSASNASTSETNAATSETNASDWAITPEDVEIPSSPGNFSALHWAAKAAASGGGGGLEQQTAKKAINQLVNNTITLVNITDLNGEISLAANTVYSVEGTIILNHNNLGGYQFALFGPTASTIFLVGGWADGNYLNGTQVNTGSILSMTPASFPGIGSWQLEVRAHIVTSSTAGTLTVQFAQQVAEVSNTFTLADSFLVATTIPAN